MSVSIIVMRVRLLILLVLSVLNTMNAEGENDLKVKRKNLPKDGDFITHPSDPKVHYYCVFDHIFNFSQEKKSALYLSKDKGESWQDLKCEDRITYLYIHPETGLFYGAILDVTATKTKDGTTYGGINRIVTSKDGVKWKNVSSKPVKAVAINSIWVDPENPKSVCINFDMVPRNYTLQAKDENLEEWVAHRFLPKHLKEKQKDPIK